MDPNVHASGSDEESDAAAAERCFGRRNRLVEGDVLASGLWALRPGIQNAPHHCHHLFRQEAAVDFWDREERRADL